MNQARTAPLWVRAQSPTQLAQGDGTAAGGDAQRAGHAAHVDRARAGGHVGAAAEVPQRDGGGLRPHRDVSRDPVIIVAPESLTVVTFMSRGTVTR